MVNTNEFVICNQQLEQKIGQNDETKDQEQEQDKQEATDKEQFELAVLEREKEEIYHLKDGELSRVGDGWNKTTKFETETRRSGKLGGEGRGDSNDEMSEEDTASEENTTSRKRKKANGYSKRKLNKKLRMTE